MPMTAEKDRFDAVIIGGGPAGISAAIWCADLGLMAVIVEKEAELGGTLLRVYNPIKNYPGLSAENGREMRDHFVRTAEGFRFERRLSSEIVSADLANKIVTFADRTNIAGRAIVIGTGTRRRELGIPGEKEFLGRGVLDSGVKHKTEVGGKHVIIVGGGDAAVENALILSENAKKITLIHRRDQFSARTEFVDAVRTRPNVDIKFNSQLEQVSGTDRLTSVTVKSTDSTVTDRIEADHVLIRIGVQPNTELFRGQIELDKGGYISALADCSTSLSNIFAIGDVANPASMSIATAAGNGATVARTILRKSIKKIQPILQNIE